MKKKVMDKDGQLILNLLGKQINQQRKVAKLSQDAIEIYKLEYEGDKDGRNESLNDKRK